MRRILVLRGGALGDFIVTLPALAALRARWPAARIELAGNATAAALARPRGLLDTVHSQHEARWSALFSPAALPAEFAAWLGDFDLVVNYWPDPDGTLQQKFPCHAGQEFLTAAALPSQLDAPAAAHYAAPLQESGITVQELWFPLAPVALRVTDHVKSPRQTKSPRRGSRNRKILVRANEEPGQNLTISATSEEFSHSLVCAGTVPPFTRRTMIYVHPGSGSPRKNWPLKNWLALIPQLPAPATVILGEAELENWSRGAPAAEVARNAARAPCPQQILVQPPLEDLVAHLSTCALFLGHDSGISHLAAACGARCVLLFGPTEPAIWAPPAPNVQVLRPGRELSAISVEAVRQAAESALADRR